VDSGTTLTYLNNDAYNAVVQVTLNPNPKPWCMDHMVSLLLWYVCVCVPVLGVSWVLWFWF
jgi:hypothetical protein